MINVLFYGVLLIPLAYAVIQAVYSFITRTHSTALDKPIKIISDAIVSFTAYCLVFIGMILNFSGVRGGERRRIYSFEGRPVENYASLSPDDMLTAAVIVVLGAISYWFVRTGIRNVSPVLYIASCSVLILNIVFSIIYFTHTGFSYFDVSSYSILFLQFGFAVLSFLYLARLKSSLDVFLQSHKEKSFDYTNKWLRLLSRISSNYQKMPRLWVLGLFPILLIIQFTLVLFGQRPDSFIRVFLETSSYNYSRIPAPPPEAIHGDGHYLCTVAANGHNKLVKPLRAGMRGGKRIAVNRQLLVANAFENIFEQYMPKGHKLIRSCYDRYGYPISRHIHGQWSADMVYLLMKPAEYLFLFVLYTVDVNPENRIHVQYSELKNKISVCQHHHTADY